MALYDGFFDAEPIFDENGEETGKYDREYGSSDFTGYFGEIIGSGVCVYENPDSFKVRLEDEAAVVSPGYLFIQGYWLRNTEDYALELPEEPGSYIVLAQLNLGQRMISLRVEPEIGTYPDSLVLAVVNTTTGTVTDTRYDLDLCGAIDAVGNLTGKVEWAYSYINNEIDAKLDEVEDTVVKQSAALREMVAEATALAESLKPVPVGTIRFSASQDIDKSWLRCDGSFINEVDYPELVAALGKVTPGVEDFHEVINIGTIPRSISNGVIYEGRFWVFCQSNNTLYGVDLSNPEDVKQMPLVCEDTSLTFVTTNPVYLTILESGELFLFQVKSFNGYSVQGEYSNLLFTPNFDSGSDNLRLTRIILPIGPKSSNVRTPTRVSLGYVTKLKILDYRNKQYYYFGFGFTDPDANGSIQFLYYMIEESLLSAPNFSGSGTYGDYSVQFVGFPGFNPKNQGENVSYVSNYKPLSSLPNSLFAASQLPSGYTPESLGGYMNSLIGGENFLLDCRIETKTITLSWILKYNNSLDIAYKKVDPHLSLPSMARVFPDAAVYMPNQDLWVMFVGTGLVFTRDPGDPSAYGYLDTTNLLGIITNSGYLDYYPELDRLYILGQDTQYKVHLAVLNIPLLYNYANDGAWLPMISSDGIPAWIKAVGDDDGSGGEPGPDKPVEPVEPTNTLSVTVLKPDAVSNTNIDFSTYAAITFNGISIGVGTYKRTFASDVTTFKVGLKRLQNTSITANLYVNGTNMISLILQGEPAEVETELYLPDYIKSGVTLQWKMG